MIYIVSPRSLTRKRRFIITFPAIILFQINIDDIANFRFHAGLSATNNISSSQNVVSRWCEKLTIHILDKNPRNWSKHTNYCGLSRCGLVTTYGGIDLSQDWLRYWLIVWRHQAVTWTKVDFSSMRFCRIHLRTIPRRVPKLLICLVNLRNILLKSQPYFPEGNE